MRFVAIVLMGVLALGTSVHAGPFGLFGRRVSNTGGSNTVSNNTVNTNYTYNRPFLGSAANVASYLASIGRIGHFGGNPYAYEGVGMGATPDQALRNCCNNGGVVADSGVCQGANGMWYACKRYHGR